VYILVGNGIVRIRKRVVIMGQNGKWVHGGGNLGRKRSRYGIRNSMEWLAYGNGNRHGIAGIKIREVKGGPTHPWGGGGGGGGRYQVE
jgi:hypothetical protein